MKILALGDVVGTRAVDKISSLLPAYIKKEKIDFTLINAENTHLGKGNGTTPEEAEALIFAGADVLTGGNHSFAQSRFYSYLDEKVNVLRPMNVGGNAPGNGYCLVDGGGRRILVMNICGRVMMDGQPYSDPFESVRRMLDINRGKYDISILDIHAEATSEKFTLAYKFDGEIDITVGTHTHVQTADERILPKGSGFITDLGMCGPINSSLGTDPELSFRKMTSPMPVRFELSGNEIELQGAVFELKNDKVTAVSRVSI